MKRTLSLLLCLCLTLPLFGGCQREGNDMETESPSDSATFVEDTLPPAEGTLKTKRIEVLPWDAGRAEACGNAFVAETESGFYMGYLGRLYYVDKANPTNWVPVCADPSCDHALNRNTCAAEIGAQFLLRNDRIYYSYYQTAAVDVWAQVPGLATWFVASMAMDGSDRRVEHIYGTPEGAVRDNSGGGPYIMCGDYAMQSARWLATDGSYDTWLMVVDQEGEYLLYRDNSEDSGYPYCSFWQSRSVYGDRAFYSVILDPDSTKAYKLENRELTSVDLKGLPTTGAYLSGDTIRIFRPGDGYYAVDLNTREEIKLGENQLERSIAHIVLPNCILESTFIGSESCELRGEIDSHSLRFFDGEQWRDVELPETIRNLDDESYLLYRGVVSDRILFLLCEKDESDSWQVYPYQILLGTEEAKLESMGSWNLYWNPDI